MNSAEVRFRMSKTCFTLGWEGVRGQTCGMVYQLNFGGKRFAYVQSMLDQYLDGRSSKCD